MRKKVLILVGTRPEVIKLAPVIRAMKSSKILKPVVCLSGQHAHMVTPLLNHFGIRPDHVLELNRSGSNLTNLLAEMARGLGVFLQKSRPACIVVQGDTSSAMLGAVAGFYEGIPVAHVEAGLRSFDLQQPFPEEFNRRVISLAAAIHFCPTQVSASNLRKEGIPPNRIRIVGNTCIDALLWTTATKSRKSTFAPGTRGILVTSHRRENWETGIANLCGVLCQLAEKFRDVEILFPVHKNPIVRKIVESMLSGQDRIRLVEPMDYPEFCAAMRDAYLIISDSGGVQEEALALGTPVLVTRNLTERPEVLEGGTVQLVGSTGKRLTAEATRLLSNPAEHAKRAKPRFPFGKGDSAKKILTALEKLRI
jgi:UDP-N-acetylglucosamine 2-epimerase (non-hydrolysing)